METKKFWQKEENEEILLRLSFTYFFIRFSIFDVWKLLLAKTIRFKASFIIFLLFALEFVPFPSYFHVFVHNSLKFSQMYRTAIFCKHLNFTRTLIFSLKPPSTSIIHQPTQIRHLSWAFWRSSDSAPTELASTSEVVDVIDEEVGFWRP